jgi:uncharacterized protein YndB with AHSA1/START domain
MKWALAAIILVGALFLAAALAGLALPQGHVASRTAHVAAPPEQVWATLTDVAAHPTWRPGLTRVEMLPAPEGRAAWREHEGGSRISYETVEAVPPRRLVTRITDRNLPFGGRWEFDVRPAAGGSDVTITEHGEVYNPIFRLISRYVLGHTATIDAYLGALQRRHAPGGAREPTP